MTVLSTLRAALVYIAFCFSYSNLSLGPGPMGSFFFLFLCFIVGSGYVLNEVLLFHLATLV